MTEPQNTQDLHRKQGGLYGGRLEIGGLLVQAGKLRPADVHRVIHYQRQHGLRFGEAAIRLGLVDEVDIREALTAQFSFPAFGDIKQQKNLKGVAAAARPFSSEVETLRALRTELVVRAPEDGSQKVLAIVSPRSGEGRSYFAANLALLFAQTGRRTLLIDADLRNPNQDKLFKVRPAPGLAGVLAGTVSHEEVQQPKGINNLHVMPAGDVSSNPLELLTRFALSVVLRNLSYSYDMIFLDTPPGIRYADAQAIAAHAGSALLIARKGKTPLRQVGRLADAINASGARVVGSVLNKY